MNVTKYIIYFLWMMLLLHPVMSKAQLPVCSQNGPVYLLTNSGAGLAIYNMNRFQPLSPGSNPSQNSIAVPANAQGLAAGPNLNAAVPATTFYIVQSGYYSYYNGTGWTPTGHSAGSPDAINSGAGGGYIFNVNVLNGDVWRYDGTGDAVWLTNISFGGCVYDMAVDCVGNFYVLRTGMPQSLRKYNSSGVLVNTYSVTGAPPFGAGAAIAVMGNDIYYYDFQYVHGVISGNSVNFQVIGSDPALMSVSDMASCPGILLQSPPENMIVCQSQLPYYWQGQNYTAAGTYTMAYPGSNGCDSVVTLQLAVNAPVTGFHQDVTVCSDKLPYIWNGQSFSAAGNYTVTFTASSGCDSTTTLALSVNPVPQMPSVLSPVNYCVQEVTVPLTASGPGNFVWYNNAQAIDGSSTPPVPATINPGITQYYVSQQIAGCESPLTVISVNVFPKPQLGPDRQAGICKDSSLNLSAFFNVNNLSISWMQGEVNIATADAITLPGRYELLAVDADGCRDTAVINVLQQPQVNAFAGNDINAEYNVAFQLSGSGGNSYDWMPSAPLNNSHLANPVAILTENTTFYLTVKDVAGCAGIDSVNISVYKGPAIYLPSAFSPNGDGLNDLFGPVAVGVTNFYYLRIYNRFGELVFESKDAEKKWDGNFKGKIQEPQNFVWILNATSRYGKRLHMQGNVMLVR